MDMRELLAQFSSALSAEIALIEKEGREQTYELLSGHRDEKSTGTLYVFVLADTLRLPEDAPGTLKVEGREISAMVVSVEGNRIWLLLESVDQIPDYLPSARLVINETDLLKRLKEKIDSLHDFGLAGEIFGLQPAHPGRMKVYSAASLRFDQHGRDVIEQCLGSDVTYIWGPPGTGKAFTIAGLVATIADLGETVLVASHTHTAVEQALWALIEPVPERHSAGFLDGSPLIDQGKILKVGELRSGRFPAKVHLNSYLEERAKERDESIRLLVAECARLAAEAAHPRGQLTPWRRLREAEALLARRTSAYNAALAAKETISARVAQARQVVAEREQEKSRAEHSFFIGRGGRVQKASHLLNEAVGQLRRGLAEAGEFDVRILAAAEYLKSAEQQVHDRRGSTTDLPSEEALQTFIKTATASAQEIEEEIQALKESAAEDARRLVEEATAIFATLTKLYVDRNLVTDLKWDTVIVDEVSMAMPPLLVYAAPVTRPKVPQAIVLAPALDSEHVPFVNMRRNDGTWNDVERGRLVAVEVYEDIEPGGFVPSLGIGTKAPSSIVPLICFDLNSNRPRRIGGGKQNVDFAGIVTSQRSYVALPGQFACNEILSGGA